VINIITSKKKGEGYMVQFNQNLSYSQFAGMDTYSSALLNYNKNRFSANANVSLLQGKDRHILHTTRDRDAEEVFLKTDLTTEWQSDLEAYLNYGLGLQYELSEKGYLSMEYAGFSEQLGGHQLSNNRIEDRAGVSFYESDIKLDETNLNNSLSLNYQQALDTTLTLFVGGQYVGFRAGANNFIDENSLEANTLSYRALRNLSDVDVDIFSAQVDLTKVYNNKNTFEYGARYSDVINAARFDFSVAPDGQNFRRDDQLSNQFSYQESITAAYMSFGSRPTDKFNYTLGLRSEYTIYELQLSQIEERKIADAYLNFFPRLSANLKLSEQQSINFAYTAGINRVPYQRLNPVLLYQDPYTSIQGNPESIPEKRHAFEVSTQFKSTSIKLGYNYVTYPFGGGALRGQDDKSYVLIRLNFDESHEYFSSITQRFDLNWLSSANTLNLRYTDIIDRQFGFEHYQPRLNLYFYSNNRITIGSFMNFEVLFWYLGDNNEGLYKRKSSWSMSLTAEKSFFNSALKCRFIANDIFHSVRAAGDYRVGETDIYFHRHWNTNYARLSLIYNFGKLTESSFKNKSVGKSEGARVR
ncbi:MAG: outer membrane beta-barrel family protein, partial [Bacteroidota bacterium]